MTWMLDIFGCNHSRTTFPLKPAGRPAYVACLDCGAEIEYDWNAMRMRGAGARRARYWNALWWLIFAATIALLVVMPQ